jgi:DNA-binding transcriptional ArsR family regulator
MADRIHKEFPLMKLAILPYGNKRKQKMISPTPRQLERLAELFAVLGDPARLRILQCLRAGPRSVGDIHRSCRLKQANTSKHLRVLRQADVVAAQREGTSVLYKVTEPLVLELCDLVCQGRK